MDNLEEFSPMDRYRKLLKDRAAEERILPELAPILAIRAHELILPQFEKFVLDSSSGQEIEGRINEMDLPHEVSLEIMNNTVWYLYRRYRGMHRPKIESVRVGGKSIKEMRNNGYNGGTIIRPVANYEEERRSHFLSEFYRTFIGRELKDTSSEEETFEHLTSAVIGQELVSLTLEKGKLEPVWKDLETAIKVHNLLMGEDSLVETQNPQVKGGVFLDFTH